MALRLVHLLELDLAAGGLRRFCQSEGGEAAPVKRPSPACWFQSAYFSKSCGLRRSAASSVVLCGWISALQANFQQPH